MNAAVRSDAGGGLSTSPAVVAPPNEDLPLGVLRPTHCGHTLASPRADLVGRLLSDS